LSGTLSRLRWMLVHNITPPLLVDPMLLFRNLPLA
jgi:hypothetical protein